MNDLAGFQDVDSTGVSSHSRVKLVQQGLSSEILLVDIIAMQCFLHNLDKRVRSILLCVLIWKQCKLISMTKKYV